MLIATPEPAAVAAVVLPVFLTVRETCWLLRQSDSSVRRAIRRGDIPSRLLGGRRMVPREELQAVFNVTDAAVLAALRPEVSEVGRRGRGPR